MGPYVTNSDQTKARMKMKMLTKEHRFHSYDRVPPCIDDYYCNRNHPSMYVSTGALGSIPRVCLECG